VIDPTIQRENLVAYVIAGMLTCRRAAEIMGETLPNDPMADVLTVTTGQGVVRLGGDPVQSGITKGEFEFNDKAKIVCKYSSDQPRDGHGRWVSSTDRNEVAKTTKNLSYACKALGIDPIDAGDAIHAAKEARRLSGADTCELDLDNGDIIFDGEVIGNLHD
jgi:hypothetical protein